MEQKFINLTADSRKSLLKKGDILVARTGATYGKTVVFKEAYPAIFASYLIKLSFDTEKILPDFYWLFTQSDEYWKQAKALMTGGGQQQFNANAIRKIKVPTVSLKTQKKLIEDMEKEEEMIVANRRFIEVMEKKISAVLGEV